MKTIIAGSRSASSADVQRALEACPWTDQITAVLSGMARGADRGGEQWARERGLPVKRYPADWDTLGRRAGYVRNEQMARRADALVAVWDGESRGTRNMIDIAQGYRLRVFIFRIDEALK